MSSTNLFLQPVGPIVFDDGMTMDEIVAFSPKPRKGRGLARRHINIALNQEAKDALVESYLVYSNGLLLTPEGEIANQDDYNLSMEEINRQVLEHQITGEPMDECIIYVPDKTIHLRNSFGVSSGLSFNGNPSPVRPDGVLRSHPDTPDLQSIPRTLPKMPNLKRSECIRIDTLNPRVAPTEPSPLCIYAVDGFGYVPVNLFGNIVFTNK
jgi:hypothetical protein